MRCIELFAGAGGLAKGFSLAGFSHDAFLEWNLDACNTLKRNFAAEKVHQVDIKTVDFNEFSGVDFVIGGPPCQPFSLGGKAQGALDERDMFPYAIKSIQELSPKAFLFENVKGLLRNSFKEYFELILLRLTYPNENLEKEPIKEQLKHLKKINFKQYKGTKYRVQFQLVNAADYGIPQRRERVIIVGIRDDLNKSWSFPEATHSEDALLWAKTIGEAKRIQTFPSDYEITGSWTEAMRQLGNAVPVEFLYIMAYNIAALFK